MAYGAYSIAAPQMSLQEELMKRQSSEDPSVDIGMKKKSLQEDLLEQIEKRQRAAQKRAGSFLGVEGLGTALTTALDIASGFMPGPFGAVTGGVSGLISGFNEMRAADKLGAGALGKEFGKYKFLQPQLRGVQAQAEEQKKDVGDVLTSAAVGALKGFTAGQLGQVGKGADKLTEASKGIDATTDVVEGAETAKNVLEGADITQDVLEGADITQDVIEGADLTKDVVEGTDIAKKTIEIGGKKVVPTGTDVSLEQMLLDSPGVNKENLAEVLKANKAQLSEKVLPFKDQMAQQAKNVFDFEGLSSADQMAKIALLTQNFAPLLQGLTAKKGPQLNLSSLY